MVDEQVAGYVTKYDVNNFQFATVKGSGHMVMKSLHHSFNDIMLMYTYTLSFNHCHSDCVVMI